MPTWRWCAPLQNRRKTPLKGGSRAASVPRVDPAHRSGGKATDSCDDGSRTAKEVPVRMVAISSSSPSCGKALPRERAHRAKHATSYHGGRGGPNLEPADSDEGNAPTTT